jgi:hypothetical protein
MPLVTLTTREGKSSEFKSAVLDAVHSALIALGRAREGPFPERLGAQLG